MPQEGAAATGGLGDHAKLGGGSQGGGGSRQDMGARIGWTGTRGTTRGNLRRKQYAENIYIINLTYTFFN